MNGESDHDLLVRIDQKVLEFHKCFEDHEERIRDIERDQLKILGVGTIAGFIAGWFSRFLNGGN